MALIAGIQKSYPATLIPPEYKTTAYGELATGIGLASRPASLIDGLLRDRLSPAAPFYFGAAKAALSALLFLLLLASDRKFV